jgi:hypothetical protein
LEKGFTLRRVVVALRGNVSIPLEKGLPLGQPAKAHHQHPEPLFRPTNVMKHQLYFPPHVSQQVLWLANFLHHFPFIAAKLNLRPQDVVDSLADLE